MGLAARRRGLLVSLRPPPLDCLHNARAAASPRPRRFTTGRARARAGRLEQGKRCLVRIIDARSKPPFATPRRTAWPMSSRTEVGEFRASRMAFRRARRAEDGAQRLAAAYGQIGQARLARVRFALGRAHSLERFHTIIERASRVAPRRAWCSFHQAVCRELILADVPQMTRRLGVPPPLAVAVDRAEVDVPWPAGHVDPAVARRARALSVPRPALAHPFNCQGSGAGCLGSPCLLCNALVVGRRSLGT